MCRKIVFDLQEVSVIENHHHPTAAVLCWDTTNLMKQGVAKNKMFMREFTKGSQI